MSDENKDYSIFPVRNNRPSKEVQKLAKRSQALINAESFKTKKETLIITGHTGTVNCCEFGEGFLLSGGEDSNIFAWDYYTGQLLRVFKGHQAAVTSIVILPNQKSFVSSDKKGYLYYWNFDSGKNVVIFDSKIYHPYRWQIPILELSLLPNGDVLIIGEEPLTVFVWVAKNNQIYRLSGKLSNLFSPGENSINYIGLYGGSTIAASSNGKFVAAASDRTIFVWDMDLGEVHYYFGGPPYKFFASPNTVYTENMDDPIHSIMRGSVDKAMEDEGCRHSRPITSLKFLPGTMKIVSCSEDKTIRIWDFSSLKKLADPPQIINGHEGCVRSIAVSKDGNYIISAGDDAKIKVHNSITGRLKDVYEGHKGSILHISISIDGNRLASSSKDATIRLWDFS